MTQSLEQMIVARYGVDVPYAGSWGSEQQAMVERLQRVIPLISEVDAAVGMLVAQMLRDGKVLPFGARFFEIRRPYVFPLIALKTGDEGRDLQDYMQSLLPPGTSLPPLPSETGLYDRLRKFPDGLRWVGVRGVVLRNDGPILLSWPVARSDLFTAHTCLHEGKHKELDTKDSYSDAERADLERQVLLTEQRLNVLVEQRIRSGETWIGTLEEAHRERDRIAAGLVGRD